MKEVFHGIVRTPQSDVLDQMSRLLFDMFVDSMDVLIPGKRRSNPYSGPYKSRYDLFPRGCITISTSRPKEDLCTRGSGNNDNNKRT